MIVTFFLFSHSYAIYKWIDDKGQVHISDSPEPTHQQKSEEYTVREQPTGTTSSNKSISQKYEQQNNKNVASPLVIPSQPQFDRLAAQKALEKALTPLVQFISILIFLGLIHLLLFILTLINIMKSEFKNNTNKILWVILVLFLPLIGVILYFFIGRLQRVEPDVDDKELPRRRPREWDL